MKRIFVTFLLLCLIFTIVGCTSKNSSILVNENTEISIDKDENKIRDEIHAVALKLLKYSNNSLGFSVVGTQADIDKLEYLQGVFNEIGLQNVHIQDVLMDGWVLDDVSLTYECNCEEVENKTIYSIGTYPRNFNFNNEYFQMVNLGVGSEADFESVGDLKDKGVLFSNSNNLENKIKMAVDKGAVFIVYSDTSEDRVNPSSFKIDLDLEYSNVLSEKVPIFVISDMIFSTLNADIPMYQSTYVKLSGNSNIKQDVNGSFLIGEIEGKNKNEIIYITANRDTLNKGYLSSCQSVGLLVSLAKELVRENIEPYYTIRFLITTGQQWGSENGGYNIGIEKYIDQNKEEKIKYVIPLDGIELLEEDKNKDVIVSSDVYSKVSKIVGDTKYNSLINNIKEVNSNDIENYKDVEGYSWLNKGYSVIMSVESKTSTYYMYKDTNKDEPSVGISSNISNDMLLFYIKLIRELSKK